MRIGPLPMASDACTYVFDLIPTTALLITLEWLIPALIPIIIINWNIPEPTIDITVINNKNGGIDYREVGGLKLPFKIVISLSGKKFQDLTVKSLLLNTGLKAQDLEKRP